MGSGSEKRQRTHQIGVRLTPDELELLALEAADQGISVAELLRKSTQDYLIVQRATRKAMAEMEEAVKNEG